MTLLPTRRSDFSQDAFNAYENEDDTTKDLAEFSLANAIFAALTEGHACEQSARCVVCPLFFSQLLMDISVVVLWITRRKMPEK